MKKSIWLFVFLLFIMAVLATPCFAGADDVLGTWLNGEKDAKIEIFKCGDRYCGKIVWLKEPNYLPADAKNGTPGTPKLDHNNPDPNKKKVPVMGLQMLHSMKFTGGNEYKDGQVYDPKNGKTYKAKMTLVSAHQLNLRGFIGFSLIGRTDEWTR